LVMVVGDRIAAVERHGARTAEIDLGNVAIVPGFVNAHTHLDLTGARGLTPPTSDFVGWLRQVIAYRQGRMAEQIQADIQAGIVEAIRHGTTLLGDISADGSSWDLLNAAPLRAVVFREFLGLPRDRHDAVLAAADAWIQTLNESETCRGGLSPHAPYSVSEKAIHDLADLAFMRDAHFAIHLAESAAEIELLAHHTGPFVEFLQELNVWDPAALASRPEVVIATQSPRPHQLLVHANYLSPEVPIPPQGSVVYCPRTHAAFGHPPHPLRQFLARDVGVALGTDSLASNPDLSILSEARFIYSRFPDLPGDLVLWLSTVDGARSLCWADETGCLREDYSADFAVVALPNRDAADPHELLFDSDLPVVATWFRGQEVFKID
jgi:cytosine/adenosine deaminase-related metal-dependent hydrolase